MECNICPRKCGADRQKGVGRCGVGENYKIARAALHFWEEPCISGDKGSGAVFFSGCNLRCVFCQNYEVSHASFGADVTEDNLIKIFDSLVSQGAHNVNLVTPSHYAPMLARTLKKFNSPVPVVYNTSAYDSVESIKMLDGLVDIYLPDIKYFDSAPALKYSGAADYFDVALEAVKEMKRQVGNLETDENGIAKKGLIIRHLVLPGNVSQTEKVFGAIAENFGADTCVSLMRQYVPCGKALNMPPLDRPLSSREYLIAKKYVLSLGFENVYLQQSSSADKEFIPDFNLEGVDIFNT